MNDNKDKNKEYVDDGHTVYNMDVDAYWNKNKVDENKVYVDKKERRSLIKAAIAAYLPKFFLIVLCFGITMLLIYFWLK